MLCDGDGLKITGSYLLLTRNVCITSCVCGTLSPSPTSSCPSGPEGPRHVSVELSVNPGGGGRVIHTSAFAAVSSPFPLDSRFMMHKRCLNEDESISSSSLSDNDPERPL